MKADLPESVRIVEVGPRDGLQNESHFVPTRVKVDFIQALERAGLSEIELTSFVSPKAIPQLADAVEVVRHVETQSNCRYSALVPNERGLERALSAGIERMAVFTAASETFARKNIHMGIAESLETFGPLVRKAVDAGLSVRGYVSTCFVCPYEGAIDRKQVSAVSQPLLDMGVDEVAVSDTIGAAVPTDVTMLVEHLLDTIRPEQMALHFHDTYGTALANVVAGLRFGIARYDASAGGLGGCPFAPGAAGNLATEDLVYMLERMGIATGIDLRRVLQASDIVAEALGRELPGRQWQRWRCSRSEESLPKNRQETMRLFSFDTVDSTNEQAKRLLADGSITHLAYITAKEQTAGRGTRGRSWSSPKGAGIYLSVVQTDYDASLPTTTAYTVAAGIACAEVLAQTTGLDIRLKPINDLYLNHGKLGGILTEATVRGTRVNALITGVGINVGRASRPLEREADTVPACLEDALSAEQMSWLDAVDLATRLAERIVLQNVAVAQGEIQSLRAKWQQYCIPGSESPI